MSRTGDLGEFEKEMKILYKNPKLAVALLIEELHVVKNKKFDNSAIDAARINPDTYHVIGQTYDYEKNRLIFPMSGNMCDNAKRR